MPFLIWKKKKKTNPKKLWQVFHNIFMKGIEVKIKGCIHCQPWKQYPLIKYMHHSIYYIKTFLCQRIWLSIPCQPFAIRESSYSIIQIFKVSRTSTEAKCCPCFTASAHPGGVDVLVRGFCGAFSQEMLCPLVLFLSPSCFITLHCNTNLSFPIIPVKPVSWLTSTKDLKKSHYKDTENREMKLRVDTDAP